MEIIFGLMLAAMGICMLVLYYNKWFPFDFSTSKGMALLTVWAQFGWIFSISIMGLGLSMVIPEDKKTRKRRR